MIAGGGAGYYAGGIPGMFIGGGVGAVVGILAPWVSGQLGGGFVGFLGFVGTTGTGAVVGQVGINYATKKPDQLYYDVWGAAVVGAVAPMVSFEAIGTALACPDLAATFLGINTGVAGFAGQLMDDYLRGPLQPQPVPYFCDSGPRPDPTVQ